MSIGINTNFEAQFNNSSIDADDEYTNNSSSESDSESDKKIKSTNSLLDRPLFYFLFFSNEHNQTIFDKYIEFL